MSKVEKISSRQNETVKRIIKQLSSPDENYFLVEGTKFVLDLNKNCILSLFTTDAEKFSSFIKDLPNVPVYEVSEPVMEKLCGAVSGQKICAIAKKFQPIMPKKLILLDGVRDPGNTGTIIRTASAFGFGCIFSEDSANPFTSKVVRSTAGAICSTYTERCKMPEKIEYLRKNGYTVLSSELDENAEKLTDFPKTEKIAIIVGNEGTGVTRDCSLRADKKLYIPIKNTNSLNAAVAAAIMMHFFSEL